MKNKLKMMETHFQNSPTHLDFEKNAKEAEKWGKENYEHWFREKLTLLEKEEMKSFTIEQFYINNYLKASKGGTVDVNQKELFSKYTLDDFKTKITLIDKALAKNKTEEAMNAYWLVKESHFNMKQDQLYNRENNIINSEEFAKFFENFHQKTVIADEYIVASLINEHLTGDKIENNILLKVHIPKGVDSGFLGINSFTDLGRLQIIIGRSYKIKYNRFSIIDFEGKQIIRGDVSLINW